MEFGDLPRQNLLSDIEIGGARTLVHFLYFCGFAKRKWVFNAKMSYSPHEITFHEGEMAAKRSKKEGLAPQVSMSGKLGGGLEVSIC